MGTRGAFGVIVGEKEKIGYNQFDSYPEGMGVENLRWLREAVDTGALGGIRLMAEELRVVSDEVPPTPEDVEALASSTNLSVSEGTTDDWYCLTRETHGHIGKTLICGYVLDSHEFPLDGLFCEWAYIVDLDRDTFEVYQGFKQSAQSGRWAGRRSKDGAYAAVDLVASWPLDALPTDEEFLATANPPREDEEGW